MKTNFKYFIKDIAIPADAEFTMERFKAFVVSVDAFKEEHGRKSLYCALTNLQALTATPLYELQEDYFRQVTYHVLVAEIFIDLCLNRSIDESKIVELLQCLRNTSDFYRLFEEA